MKVWKLSTAKTLVECNEDLPVTLQEKEIKVKVTKLLLTEQDYYAYAGGVAMQYPRIPVRCGIGRIIDGFEKFGLEKNARVFLQDTLECNHCANCLSQEAECLHLRTAGINYDGFLREFLITNLDNAYILPTQINDKAALFISPLSLCLEIVDKLQIEVGTQVLIAGANYIGILLAQLLLYKKAIPILVDASIQNLELAKNVGIYYTFLADENLYNNINKITGGRLVAKSVFTNNCLLSTALVEQLTSFGGTVVFAGFYLQETSLSIKNMHAKGLTLISINNSSKNKENAINLLANKMIDVSLFPTLVEPIANIQDVYTYACNQLQNNKVLLSIIDMLS